MEISNESDDLLLARMGRRDDRGGFEAAWAEFHRRHCAYLYGVCFRACRDGDRREGAKDLANATFKRILESKAKFTPPPDVGSEEMPLHVRAWLGRIARRIAIDQSRGAKGEAPILLALEEWQDIRERPGGVASRHTSEVCRALNEELDERSQDIIRTTFNAYDPVTVNQKLSSEDIQTLAARWGTTPDNIRQIRKRALAKLKKALLASMPTVPSEREVP